MRHRPVIFRCIKGDAQCNISQVTGEGRSRNILIVDDEPAIRRLLGAYLSSKGWSCEAASNPEEALERLRRGTISHAVVDIHLGRHSGLALIRAILRLYPAVRVVAMTGSDEITIEEVSAAGASALLRKPFATLEGILSALA